ncbi:hypothetical protein [Streptomyces eurocidicus]|uniref:Lipoprotein n=1 Tax=Streptomyces eurocidicus TaxID=66423 RepID=A0A7W8B9F6_STREU|nr:hypothetical protein [Streptomyces eurocidicus]MBB5117419.1 hypothetical protein [Streptomyces eurocidicus]MBF6053264.1 hypothetical protein [Streptomyces eurocidicus]
MGALRRLRARQVLYAAGVAALVGPAALMLAGCEPAEAGGLDSVSVAVTTDKRATGRLQHDGYPVQWLSCISTAEPGGSTDKGSPRPVSAVGVDCEGRTGGGQKIIVYGRVTGIHGETCVQGRLTGKVDGKTAFTASVLGECEGSGTTTGGSGGGTEKPDAKPDVRPGKSGGRLGPSPDCTEGSGGPKGK